MKRTELKRGKPLKRVPGPKRTGKMKAVSDKRRKRDAPYKAARVAVHERADGQCEYFGPFGLKEYGDGLSRCPAPMTEVHHLAGRRIADPHALSNLIGLCRWHHDQAHANPEWARSVGLMRTRIGRTA